MPKSLTTLLAALALVLLLCFVLFSSLRPTVNYSITKPWFPSVEDLSRGSQLIAANEVVGSSEYIPSNNAPSQSPERGSVAWWYAQFDLPMPTPPEDVLGPAFDPTACGELVWRPRGHSSTAVGSSTYAFAITSMDHAYVEKVVAAALRLRMISLIDITIMVLRSGTTEAYVARLRELLNAAEILRTKVVIVSNPIDGLDLGRSFLRLQHYMQKRKLNCCGESEFIKLRAVALPYDRVLLLDLDVTVLKPVDHLFRCSEDLLYTGGPFSPLNGGVLMLRGNSPALLRRMLSALEVASKNYTGNTCFDKELRCGPCDCKRCRRGPGIYSRTCRGQEGPQGFLFYYYVLRQRLAGEPPLRVRRIASCVYNLQIDKCFRESFAYQKRGLSPFIAHKPKLHKPESPSKLLLDKMHPSHNQPASKVCRPNFWIVGARKAATTALYTYMTAHPGVAKLRVSGSPRDGEFYKSVKTRLAAYNAMFRDAGPDLLVGDASVNRLITDHDKIFPVCGHRYTKVFVLLRDPVARCHSQMLMRARLGTHKMSMSSNITKVILPELRAFRNAVKLDPGWADEIVPRRLGGWGSSQNCLYEGVYAAHLKRWLYHGSFDNIRVYFTDDFQKYTADIVRDALAFVGLNSSLWDAKAVTATSRINARNHDEPLPPNLRLEGKLRSDMRAALAPYDEMLESVLGMRPPWAPL